MSNEETIARQLFADHGITIGNVMPEAPQLHVEFSDGSECHAFIFEDGYIHFHIGTDAWKEVLASDAPNVRIREMRVHGKPVAESEWFSC